MAARARVVIQRPGPAHETDFIAAMRASRRMHRPWISMPDTPLRFAEYVARAQDPTREFFIARRTDDGAVVGFCNLSEIIRGKLQQAFMGYGGVAGQDGRGFMTETLQLVLRQ